MKERIGIVGVCASGKTMLARALQERGYDARQISQEHSYVPDLWRRFSRADILIFLDVTLPTIRRRLNDPSWPDFIYEAQRERLRHARENCHFYLDTDAMPVDEVLGRVLSFLDHADVKREA
jgi:shikimate kinase